MSNDPSARSNPSHSIVMVIQTFYPTVGGAEKQCLVLSKALQERGFRIMVLIERKKGFSSRDVVEGVPVRRLGWGGTRIWNSVSFMISIFLYLLRHARDYGVIHVHLAASHAVAASLAGRILGKKVVVLIGGGKGIGEIALSRKTFPGQLKLWALAWLKPRFIVLSESQKDELRGFGLERVPVRLIPNGVDMRIYHSVTLAEKKALRKKTDWDGLIFLYTGRFSDEKITVKTFRSLLSGWAMAIKQRRDIHFYLAGHGPLEAEYKKIIQEMGLDYSVHLLPSQKEVNELYQAADVFMLPTSTEGQSNSMLEAMATSLPIVASRAPGITGFIEENVHGLLLNPDSPEDVRDCLKKIFDGTVDLETMGDQAGLLALRYSINETVEQYMSFYDEP